MTTTRGIAISAYQPAFSKGAKIYGANIQSGVVTSAHIQDGTVVAGDVAAGSITSAKLGVSAVTNAKILPNAVRNVHISAKAITSAKIKAVFVSGTIVSGRTTRAIAHALGVKPKFIVVNALPTLAQAVISATGTANQVFLAAASAATSANFYVIGTQAANAAIKYVAYLQA